MTYGVTLGIATAANVLTLYLFYEFLTLCTLPLVMHGTSKASVRAGYTYMMYSFFGAALAFVGVMLIIGFGDGGAFVMGGVMSEAAAEHPLMVQIGYLCAFLGFGVKAAVFPFHVWLPEASVAPTPVTALLHAVAVVKSGVFAIIRVTYFSFGAQVMRGHDGAGDCPAAGERNHRLRLDDGGQGASFQAPSGVFDGIQSVLYPAGGVPDDAERSDCRAGAYALPCTD